MSDTPLTDGAKVIRSRINAAPNSGADAGAEGFDEIVTVKFAQSLERRAAELAVLVSLRIRNAAQMCTLVADTKLQPCELHTATDSLKSQGLIRVVSNGRTHVYAINQL